MLKQLHAMEELQHEPQPDAHLYPVLHLDVAQGVCHMNVPEEEEETHHLNLANLVLDIVEVQVSRAQWKSLLKSCLAKHHLCQRCPGFRRRQSATMAWTSTQTRRRLRT